MPTSTPGESAMPVWNRDSILELFTRELARSASSGSNLAVILARIDCPTSNRQQTESQDDRIAAEIAKVISAVLRPFDYVGRYSPTTFMILAPGLETAEERALAERLRGTVADSPVVIQGARLRFTISLAMASSSDFRAHDGSNVLQQLQTLLNRIEAQGGNGVEVLGGIIPATSRNAAGRSRFQLRWVLLSAAVLGLAALIFLIPSWTCAPNLVSDLFDSGELPPPLPPDCVLTAERPSDDVFQSLEKQREASELELQQTVVCKMSSQPRNHAGNKREQQWLGSIYTEGRLQYRRHVLISASQDVAGGKLFAVEQCLTPWWKYITESKQYCRTQNLPWE